MKILFVDDEPGIFQFIDSTIDLSAMASGTYDFALVALSFIIASVSGYVALLITKRISMTERQHAPHVWLATGAFAVGSGIWATHFIGMLAFTPPTPVNYDRALMAISILPAFLAGGVAVRFMATDKMGFWQLNIGGILLTAGIGAMHYTGMAGMTMNAEIR